MILLLFRHFDGFDQIPAGLMGVLAVFVAKTRLKHRLFSAKMVKNVENGSQSRTKMSEMSEDRKVVK